MNKTLSTIVAISALSTMLNANEVLTQAKSMGLKSIPSDKNELMKLIDNPKNPKLHS